MTAAARSPHSEPEGPPLPQVARALQAELADLGDAAERLQALLGPRFVAQPTVETLLEAQALDLLCQRLRGVADFLRALAPTLPGDVHANTARAAREVKLADLARRLALAAPPAPADSDDSDDSDLELF